MAKGKLTGFIVIAIFTINSVLPVFISINVVVAIIVINFSVEIIIHYRSNGRGRGGRAPPPQFFS